MALSRTTRKLIETGNLGALEDEWFSRMNDVPEDLDYFVSTARFLSGSGEENLCHQLLELLDEQLVSDSAWAMRLDLLRRAGHLLFDAVSLHGAILESLGAMYSESDLFAPLAERVGLHRAVTDIPKTWKKAEQLQTLMSYDRGTVVWMEGKGVGEVTDVNTELEKLRINLKGKGEITVGFGAAAKMLEVLPESHFLYQKIKRPDSLSRLASSDPTQALRLLLESAGKPLTAAAIREAVTGVIDQKGWTSWWSGARNHPQLMTSGSGARQTYGWAASSDAASEEALRAFSKAKLPAKLEIYRREVKRKSETASEMATSLERLVDSLANKSPAEAFAIAETLESAGCNDREGPTPRQLLEKATDPVRLVASLEDKALRRRSLSQLREARRDWISIFADLMERETEPRILSDLAGPLADEAPERLTQVFDGIVAHPRRKAAAFVWLAENLPSFPFLEGRNPLRLMQLILSAGHAREFTPFRSRLTKLVEASETLPHLLDRLEADQAQRAEEILERAPYEEYVRQPLINALHLRFPELVGETSDALYALPSSIEAQRRDLKNLLDKEIPANRKAIEEARALGDLRENFEYKSARQRHEYLSARATKLDRDLRRARAIDPSRVDPSEVRIGTVVGLEAGGRQRTVTILGPWESNPDAGVISYEADSALRLLGRCVGDQVDEDGKVWTVRSIDSIPADS